MLTSSHPVLPDVRSPDCAARQPLFAMGFFQKAFAQHDARKRLKRISKGRDLRGYIARTALEATDIRAFFRQLDEKGCYGLIPRDLITAKRFDTHYDEITTAIKHWQDERWSIKVREDIKTEYLHYALRQIGREIEREVFLERDLEHQREQVRQREAELQKLMEQRQHDDHAPEHER